MSRSTKRQRLAKAMSKRKVWGSLTTLAGVTVFLSSLTGKDSAQYAGKTMGAKASTLINNVFGRITGWNPIASAPQFPQTINTNLSDYTSNPWLKIGLGGAAYSIGSGFVNKMAGKRILKHGGKIGTIAGTVITSAILGTVFDAVPLSQNYSISQNYTSQVPLVESTQ